MEGTRAGEPERGPSQCCPEARPRLNTPQDSRSCALGCLQVASAELRARLREAEAAANSSAAGLEKEYHPGQRPHTTRLGGNHAPP